MNNRKSALIKSLNKILSSEKIEHYLNYQLDNSHIDFLKINIREILSIIPPDAYNCANLSSLLGAVIMDNSNIPLVIMTGHLDYNGNRIFNCDKAIPTEKNNIKGEFWNGHCWIEFGQYILDISIFRTVYYAENFPEKIKRDIVSKYGEGKGALMIPIESIEEYGFEYTPCFALDDKQISGLVQGTNEKYLKKN